MIMLVQNQINISNRHQSGRTLPTVVIISDLLLGFFYFYELFIFNVQEVNHVLRLAGGERYPAYLLKILLSIELVAFS